MLTEVYTAGLNGTEGFIVRCEVDVGNGMPGFNMIGQLSSEVKEAQERVKTAIRNYGFYSEPKHITVNLSPAEIRKEGCGYDLAIALGILMSYGYIDINKCTDLLKTSVFIGEVSLGGELLPVRGTLSLASAARDAGYKRLFVPEGNAVEGAAIDGISCYGIKNLKQIIEIMKGEVVLPPRAVYFETTDNDAFQKDFSDIYGQELIKRATVIGVSGRHNILYIGPAGTGKSMIASRIPTILPVMSRKERIEISKLYSICGFLPPDEPLIRHRPFRNPHHTISSFALTGGGAHPKPGEISLATGGVLFLDELAEFKSQTIEALRQPLEDKKVLISRVNGSIEYPADFVLCAATNPCKCGYYPDRKLCHCTPLQVKSYLGKISKPLLDRIDICVETALPDYNELNKSGKGQTSEEIRVKVETVRQIQLERFKNEEIYFNSEMTPPLIEQYCTLSHSEDTFIHEIYEKKHLSARGLHKILKVARTIADYEEKKDIGHEHLCEAIGYRFMEDKYWGGGMEYETSYTK